MRWVGHDDVVQVNLFGHGWDRPCPPPRVMGIPRHSDRCTGVMVGGVFYERRHVVNDSGPLEQIRDLVLRVADEIGTESDYTLVYKT